MVPFEIYSDHESLKHLFTQKALPQRLLRLCEILADYNFTEIKYVPGGSRLSVTPMGINITIVSYQYAGDVLARHGFIVVQLTAMPNTLSLGVASVERSGGSTGT